MIIQKMMSLWSEEPSTLQTQSEGQELWMSRKQALKAEASWR